MWCSVFAIAILLCSFFQEGGTVYSIYQVQKIKRKLFKMIVDLIFDAKSKIQHVQYVRKSYRQVKAYEYAAMIYDIRRKYARMLFIHKRVVREISKPYVDYKDTNSTWYQKHMLETVHTGFEIDKLVQAIEEYEYDPHAFIEEIIENRITTLSHRRTRATRPTTKRTKRGRGRGRLRADNSLHDFFSLRQGKEQNSDIYNMARFDKNNKYNPFDINNVKKDLDGMGFDSDKD